MFRLMIRHEPGTSFSSTGALIAYFEEGWPETGAYRTKAQELAGLVVKNFAQEQDGVSEAVRAAGPKT